MILAPSFGRVASYLAPCAMLLACSNEQSQSDAASSSGGASAEGGPSAGATAASASADGPTGDTSDTGVGVGGSGGPVLGTGGRDGVGGVDASTGGNANGGGSTLEAGGSRASGGTGPSVEGEHGGSGGGPPTPGGGGSSGGAPPTINESSGGQADAGASTLNGGAPSNGGQLETGGSVATGGGGGDHPETGGTVASGGQPSSGGQSAAAGSAMENGGQGSSGGPSLGCGVAGAPTGVKADQTITVAGQTRTYVLSVPTNYTGSTPLALVLVWHGANLSGSLARTLFNLESNSDGAAIFVYPDGLEISAGMTGWDLATGSDDFQLFTALIDEISTQYCVDPNRIFSTGHSMGAMMTNSLACQYGDVLRAIAPASGAPPGGGRATCTGEVAALIAHGQNDTTVDIAQGEASRDFWLAQNGCTTETTTWAPEAACVEYQGCETDLPVVWCVHDEGHSWPSLTFGCEGGVCFDGGSAIWAFFAGFQ